MEKRGRKNRNAQDKAFEFSVAIVNMCLEVRKNRKEYDLTRQLIRSGTSIGANLEEAIGTQTQKEIYHKIHIAYREARESRYWIRILLAAKLIRESEAKGLIQRVDELLRILGASISTMKRKMN